MESGGDGIFGLDVDGSIMVTVILCILFLCACIKLCRRKFLGPLCQTVADGVGDPAEWKYMFIECCFHAPCGLCMPRKHRKPRQSPTRPRAPSSRPPELYPPPPTFCPKQRVKVNENRQSASLQPQWMRTDSLKPPAQRNPVLAQNLARFARYRDDQPLPPSEAPPRLLGQEHALSIPRAKSQNAILEAAPRLVGQEQAATVPRPKSEKRIHSPPRLLKRLTQSLPHSKAEKSRPKTAPHSVGQKHSVVIPQRNPEKKSKSYKTQVAYY